MEVNITPHLPWKETYLVPIGDIQLGAQGVDLDALKRDIDRGLEHNARFCGVGDYLDVASPSGRQKIVAADLYDSVHAAIADRVEQHREQLQDILEPTRGRWLGMCQGHHYLDFGDGTTTDTRLAEWLGSPFLGDAAYLRMRWQSGAKRVAKDGFLTHGVGSGITQAAPLNKLEKVSGGIMADFYLINHYARRGVIPRDIMTLDQQGNIRSKTIYMIATGGYMKAYNQGNKRAGRPQGTYVEKALMTPTTMGGVLIKFTPFRKRVDGEERLGVDIKVEV